MSLITDVEAFFSDIWETKLKPDVAKIEDVAIAFFSAAAKEAAKELGALGLQIITDAVGAAETAGGTGDVKLAAAKAKIAEDLDTAGITAAKNVINSAIEGAVAQLNAPASISASDIPAAAPVISAPVSNPA